MELLFPYLLAAIGAVSGIASLVMQNRTNKADIAARYQKMVTDATDQYDKMEVKNAAKFLALEETLSKERTERVAEQALWRNERYDLMLQVTRQQAMMDSFKTQIDELNAIIKRQDSELAKKS